MRTATVGPNTMHSALVLFSGGQDSTTCLAWALDRFERVETIGFHYGQRHAIEMDCRKSILSLMGKHSNLGKDYVLQLPEIGALSSTALTSETDVTTEPGGLPNTFVPGRNLLFLTYAAVQSFKSGHKHLVGGMCETDFSGYPDCRASTIKAMESAINLGMETRITIHTPLMYLTKAETWRLASELGSDELVQMVIGETHTCYIGDRSHLHEWGYGCGECPACQIRARGYHAFRNQ